VKSLLACKVIQTGKLSEKERKFIKLEIKAQRSLQGKPNVVQLVDCVQDRDRGITYLI
jgi:serine/threonine protein kinase